jgi:hypothetical protein
MHPVTIENDAIVMEVWPQIGGKVSSIIDKTDHYELLFDCPAEIPDSAHYDVPYGDHWYSGWDECFPAVAPSVYPRHPYSGIAVPDHGELWGIPTTTAVPTKDGITTVWHGLRFGYRLTRKLYLQNAAIVAEYSLSNLSPFDFRFVWAMHALLSLIQPVELDAEGARNFRFSHAADGTKADATFTWPSISSEENLSRPDSLPVKKGWKSFSVEPIASAFVVRYPTRNRSLRIEYESKDGSAAYWGVWINTGGWAGNRHFAIEPTSGRYDEIDRSIQDGSAGQIEPFGRREWSVRWTLG